MLLTQSTIDSYFTVTAGVQGLEWDIHDGFIRAADVVLDGLPDCTIMNGIREFNQMRFFVWQNVPKKIRVCRDPLSCSMTLTLAALCLV